MSNQVYEATYNAMREFNLGWYAERAVYDFGCFMAEIRDAHTRPSSLLRPTLTLDGNMFCVLYGSNLQEGIAGFGETAELAFADFDKNFREWRAPSFASEPRIHGGTDVSGARDESQNQKT